MPEIVSEQSSFWRNPAGNPRRITEETTSEIQEKVLSGNSKEFSGGILDGITEAIKKKEN